MSNKISLPERWQNIKRMYGFGNSKPKQPIRRKPAKQDQPEQVEPYGFNYTYPVTADVFKYQADGSPSLEFDPYHLPVTHESVIACLNNPAKTYDDCQALYSSLTNHPEFGACSEEAELALRAMGEIAVREYREWKAEQ